jgi:hypothetical protein
MTIPPKKIFISYSWDNEDHINWVVDFATELRTKYSLDVVLDKFKMSVGSNPSLFMESSILECEKVIIVLTSNYKLKADKLEGGVGQEYSIIKTEIGKDLTLQLKKFLPVLREGTPDLSIPAYLQIPYRSDLRSTNTNYEKEFSDLIRSIYNKPLIDEPPIGESPLLVNILNN